MSFVLWPQQRFTLLPCSPSLPLPSVTQFSAPDVIACWRACNDDFMTLFTCNKSNNSAWGTHFHMHWGCSPLSPLSLAPYKYKSDFQLNLFVVLVLCVLRSAKSGLNFNSALFSFWALWNMLNNQLLQLRDLSTFLMLLAVSHVCVCACCCCPASFSCSSLPGLKFAIPMRKVLKSRSCPCVYVRVCACLMSPGETAYSVSANVLIISL